jgi:acyl carrier protein
MNRSELEKKIIELVSIQISWEIVEILPKMDFVNDLGFDSLDAIEFTMTI